MKHKLLLTASLIFLLVLVSRASNEVDSMRAERKWARPILHMVQVPHPTFFGFSQSFYMDNIESGYEVIIHHRHAVRINGGYFIPNIVGVSTYLFQDKSKPNINHGPHLSIGYSFYPMKKPRGPKGFYFGPYASASYVMSKRIRNGAEFSGTPYTVNGLITSYGIQLGYRLPVDVVLIDIGLGGGYSYSKTWKVNNHNFYPTANIFQQDMFYKWPFDLNLVLGVLF
ncbi:MAG: hypothetical protein U0V74_08385 [Chitinophagales bacterium]